MTTITRAQLEQAFEVYLGEMACCDTAKCYWALLHLVIIMPDICAALESTRGEAKPKYYMDWCRRYLASPSISPKEWYEIRNLILHQGRTKKLKGRYAGYSSKLATSARRESASLLVCPASAVVSGVALYRSAF